MYKTGFGYDVHRFEENRKLILGGVLIPNEKGLSGHSDADVLSHAITDALLGAAGLSDIGTLFPDTDEKYKDADSILLLKAAYEEVKKRGYEAVNIDSTLVLESPKISPYKKEMERNIALALGISEENVNVKGKTEEKLGFTGEGLGIKAYAVCLIKKVK